MVEVIATIQQAIERCPLEFYGLEHGLTLGGTGQPVELGEEVAQEPDGLPLTIMGQEGAGEALEISNLVPVRRGR